MTEKDLQIQDLKAENEKLREGLEKLKQPKAAVDMDKLTTEMSLTDKNGNKIWENELAGFGIRYRERNDPTAWENSSILKCATSGWKNQFAAEVIGNVFDNPELLKEE